MALVDRMNHEVRQLKPSDILQFNAEISGIEGIVKLTLGEPDFPTPEHVKAAGHWRYLFEFNGYVEQRRYRDYPNSDFSFIHPNRVIKRSKTNIYRHFGGWVHS